MSILILEDDENTLYSISTYLSETNRSNFQARNARTAMSLLDGFRIRVALIDYLLEDGNSEEVILKIKAMPTMDRPTMVLMTASVSLERVALDHQIERVLKKPFSLEDFERQLLLPQ